MKLPSIEINGKVYGMKKPTARFWGTWVRFNDENKTIADANFVDKHCEILAEMFEGVSKDDLLDNLLLEDVMKVYNECSGCLIKLLTGKFEEVEKNSEAAGAAEQA